MFAPIGFALFEEIISRIGIIVADAYPWANGMFPIDVSKKRRLGRRLALAEFAERCPSLSVASPSGTVLRIAPEILSQRGFDFPLGPYTYLDINTGLIDTAQTEQVAKWATDSLTPYFAKIDADPSLQPALEGIMTEFEEAVEARLYAPAFQNFNGWAVVCLPEDLPKSVQEFDCLSDGTAREDAPSPPSREIEAHIVELIDNGFNPVRDVLWKTEFPDLKREEFRAVWASARKLRPELSNRGPKTLKNKKLI